MSLSDPAALSSLQAFLQSARECLTPRGLSQTIGTTSKQYVPAENLQAAGAQLLHDFYIWNGRDAHPLARAGSLAGALKAEKKLKKKHYIELLRTLFYRDVWHFTIHITLGLLTRLNRRSPLLPLSSLWILTPTMMSKVSSSPRTDCSHKSYTKYVWCCSYYSRLQPF